MGSWVLPEAEGLRPGGRGGHALVSVGTKLLLFGGSDRAPITYNDLWLLETAETPLQWTRISPILSAGCQVQPRSGASLTAVGTTVYLYGGQEPVSDTRFGDLKALDTDSWTWADVSPAPGSSAPAARHSHTMCSLAGQCLLLYGGSGAEGTLRDVWIFNTGTGAWTRPSVKGPAPPGREMHGAAMISSSSMLVYGGRSTDAGVLCDAAVFDAHASRWTAMEPTPFPRCAHSCVALPSPAAAGRSASGGGASDAPAHEESSGAQNAAQCTVLVYGGFTGESVQGDVLRIDPQSLEVEQLHRGPGEGGMQAGVPTARFAHAGTSVPWLATSGPGSTQSPAQQAMVVFGGVSAAEDLNDLAIWTVNNK